MGTSHRRWALIASLVLTMGLAGTASAASGVDPESGPPATVTAVATGADGIGWRSIAPGGTSCGIRTDDTGWCWGINFSGEVGDGTTINRTTPTQLPGSWTSLTSILSASCGIRTDTTGWCWGLNINGALGDGTTTTRTTPTQLPGNWSILTTSGRTTCGSAPTRPAGAGVTTTSVRSATAPPASA